MDYYPDRIAEDDDDTRERLAGKDVLKSSLQSSFGESSSTIDFGATDTDERNHNYNMAALIQNERNRRLGVREHDADTNNCQHPPQLMSSIELPPSSNSAGVLGNIRGWFGGGGGAVAVASGSKSMPSKKAQEIFAQSSAPVSHTQSNKTNYSSDDSYSSSSEETSDDDDDHSSSQSSDASDRNANLTPQERARARALRYLSDSCVDAGRKAKTASYVRGLERLDLKRRRDRYEKELEIVEAEMYKDRELKRYFEEKDAILSMAAVLVWEVPKILESKEVDAGAGSGLGENVTGNESFIAYEEYADTMSANGLQPSPWDEKGAVEIYESSLQSRLKDAQERTRSLDKRLGVLEQAGDDIISSLCEDLAEITGHSSKVEARYVKKGKELQRRRRQQELLYRSKIEQAELRVRRLEERILIVSGDQNLHDLIIGVTSCDTSNEGSTSCGDDDENDEVLLEKKLSAIKAKNEQDKIQHELDVESIRRQCEQLKLRLSVARLVMEGDDNLREYMALLERQRKNCNISQTDRDPIPAPPFHITRARAKLLKVAHLECIYEQRLSVSKAFTDATINALDQELLERESAAQKMEVRCLNELLLIDVEIKDIVREASDKLSELESEANELEEATLACVTQDETAEIGDLLAVYNTLTDQKGDAIAVKDDILIGMKTYEQQFELDQSGDVDSPADDGIAVDELHKPETSSRDEVGNYKLVERDSMPDADTFKIGYDIADVKSLASEDHRTCSDAIVKYSHTDKMNDDVGDEANGDLSAPELEVEIFSSPQVENTYESGVALLKPNEGVNARVELRDIHIADSEVFIFEGEDAAAQHHLLSEKLSTFANQNGTAIDSSEGSNPDIVDEYCDGKGKKPCMVNSQKEAVLQSLERELNCTQMERNAIAKDASEGSNIRRNSPQFDIPADETVVKVCSQNGDEHCDVNVEKSKKSSTVDSQIDFQKDAALQSLERELNCTPMEQNATAKDASDGSDIRLNSPQFDIPADETAIKVFSHNGDEHCDENGEKSSTLDSQNEAILQSLGRELNCTLAEYQTSYDLSTSHERVEQLNYMNDLVVAIAKVSGLRIENVDKNGTDLQRLKSWSYKKSQSSSERERKSSKKKKKKTRQHCGSGRNKANEGIDRSGLGIKLHSRPDSLDHSLVW
jgi:hypothetical protein